MRRIWGAYSCLNVRPQLLVLRSRSHDRPWKHRRSHWISPRRSIEARVQLRRFHISTALAPPAIFFGLFITLWCWKCTMLVLFQNTIIYNPFLPPNARSLQISDYAKHCGGIKWREETIRSLDGTQIALCTSEVSTSAPGTQRPVYILYMQGSV